MFIPVINVFQILRMMTFYGLMRMGNYPKVIIILFGACLVYLTKRATNE